ncbi:uncharacterized protein LODBEIA_P55710 [Lodderomyces beijingensis]|uniref:Mitochondrial fusion and transport protein UGO1 n=1 Tax=Lodderomyces beijingensis TaxID=1775926 RepID=A0ABP0ZV86_9ASCO
MSTSSSGKLDSYQLRPYYDHDTFDAGYSVIFKKGVGLWDPKSNKPMTANLSSHSIDNAVNQNASALSKPGLLRRAFDRQGGGVGINAAAAGTGGGGGGDKNFIYDLEFNEYFDPNNLLELIKNLMWNFAKSYIKVLIAQPLEITRLVLQVGKFNISNNTAAAAHKKKEETKTSRLLGESEFPTSSASRIGDNDILSKGVNFVEDDEPIDYFQPQNDSQVWANPQSSYEPITPATAAVTAGGHADVRHKPEHEFVAPPLKRLSTKKRLKIYKIQPKSLHTVDIMSAICGKDSFFALFRGVNTSFMYQTLSSTIEAWLTGFISPFLGIPDPFFLDLTHSNDPFKSLWLSVGACVLTGLALMPLDLVRIKFMITQPNNIVPLNRSGSSSNASSVHGKEDLIEQAAEEVLQNTRSIRESIRYFPTYYLSNFPLPIVLLTTLYQLSSSVFRKMAPYLLFIKFNIDSYSSPAIYTIVNLLSLICEFFIKLPVENLLRKEQVSFLLRQKKEDPKKVLTIVKPEENMIVVFNGLPSSQEEEGMTFVQKVKSLGLFNGWRVGLLNVVGFWGYNLVKHSGHEKEERL